MVEDSIVVVIIAFCSVGALNTIGACKELPSRSSD